MSFRFQDRADAGRLLADKLEDYANHSDVVVLGLPRGGVPVAYEVARRLNAPLDIFLVRKLGVPGQDELAMGAIASGGVCFFNSGTFGISPRAVEAVVARERVELKRRETAFRTGPLIELRDRLVILVDDGLATGATMRAAVLAVREHAPKRVVVAVPVAAPETVEEFAREVGEIVCLQAPEEFTGVGQWYNDFTQTTDKEVRALLAAASRRFEKIETGR
ncbi:MAG TPA: phosphoribosyltransferase [Verrucomicrobiae bacterium]|jgi:predicted phosphoribosyltransferase|nr:phosphoribosyltransferase [Verrucomicrobiae bacterium]